MMIIKRTETEAARKRAIFRLELKATGGPANAEAGGQPQMSVNGGAWANTVNVLVLVGNGMYYLQLDDAEIDYDSLTKLLFRYASAAVFEAGPAVQITEATNKEILDAVELNTPQQHFAEASSMVLQGTTVSGSYLNTFIDDDISWVIQPGAGEMNVQLNFNAGIGRIAFEVALNGMFDANPQRFTDAYAYNYVTLVWDKISNVDTRMNNSSSHQDYIWFLTSEHTNPTTGDARIRLMSTSTNTGDRLEIDRIIVLSVNEASGLTPASIAEAVWDHDVRDHEAHDTAAFYQVAAIPAIGDVIAVTDESTFQVEGLEQSAGTLVGKEILVHDELAKLYYEGIIKTNDALGNIVLYEPLAILPELEAGVIIRNRNFDHEHNRVDVGSINGAPIAGELVPGVIQAQYTVRDNTDQIVYRDDTPTLIIVAPSGWDFSGKKVFLAAKLDLDQAASIVDRECTVIDSRTASITLTAAETAVNDKYFGEFSQTDMDGSSNQKTIQRFGLVIRKDVRD